VTGDHTTPTKIGDHTFEPVPILITVLSNYLNPDIENSKDRISLIRDKTQ